MTLPVLNTALLSAVVTWAVNDAKHIDSLDGVFGIEWGHHNQRVWAESQEGVCGSSYCIAGQAASQVGYKMVLRAVDWDSEGNPTDYTANYAQQQQFAGLGINGKPVYQPIGEQVLISEAARTALGLNSSEGSELFEASNSIERIVGFALMFAAVRGVTLDLLPEVETLGRDYLDGFKGRLTDFFGFWGMDDREGYLASVQSGLWPEERCDSCGQVLPTS